MFLNQVNRRNPKLVEAAISLHQSGLLEPDTYLIDYDQTMKNAEYILEEANKQDIHLYFMLKQVGRNPLLAKGFMDLGYKGAVVVDYREAQIMMQHQIPLGNVGHLVQTPKHLLKDIIAYGTEVFTVFTMEKLIEIHEAARKLSIVQDVILKVYSEGDMQYRGQEGGVDLRDLDMFLNQAETLSNVKIVGATAFPAFLYDAQVHDMIPTHNYGSIMSAIQIMKSRGLEIKQVNVPSTTSVRTLQLMEGTETTHGEPGHGLTGTTPAHATVDMVEVPSVVYLSEISHNFQGKSYCYGGGHYRRSHVKNALVCGPKTCVTVQVEDMDPTGIDYYFELNQECPVSSSVVMAFRFQMFVTRSNVAIVKGIASGQVEILGIYDGLGKKA